LSVEYICAPHDITSLLPLLVLLPQSTHTLILSPSSLWSGFTGCGKRYAFVPAAYKHKEKYFASSYLQVHRHGILLCSSSIFFHLMIDVKAIKHAFFALQDERRREKLLR